MVRTLPGAQVQSLVREVRSHMPSGVVRKKKVSCMFFSIFLREVLPCCFCVSSRKHIFCAYSRRALSPVVTEAELFDDRILNFHLCSFSFQLSINIYDYNCHVDLIRLLRLEGELTKVRMARQKMSEIFPLTEGSAFAVEPLS